jgi:redox-sensitive bicupin YhaK (pirin superfamily)
MKEIRTIRKVVKGKTTVDGAGVKLVREIGFNDTADFDPFLMLDAFDSTDPADYIKGFPWHPHRGIETVTYLIEGNVEHGDSMGNKGSILTGECQWMTAGSGIIHQEMPQPSERMLGTQLWVNLPAKHKIAKPKYRAITQKDIPAIDEKGTIIRILCGTCNENKGAIEGDYVKAQYLDVEMSPNSDWTLSTEPDHTLFIYILRGEAVFGDETATVLPERNVLLFSEGKKFMAKTFEKGIRFLLMSGKPLREPIAWGGPIVMNTEKELELAFEELENDTFIKD